MLTILQGDAIEQLRTLPSESVHCCVTSPPYWGLRDYSTNGQLGLEKTPEEYVAKMVEVFREVRRVLRKDGTLWLNLGDSYAGPKGNNRSGFARPKDNSGQAIVMDREAWGTAKQLCGIPWRVAFALQADGWWLRSDIIWAKPNPMPESVTDRPTKAHEYLFLLTKSANYFYDAEAIKERYAECTVNDSRVGVDVSRGGIKDYASAGVQNPSDVRARIFNGLGTGRNKRSVWTVATAPYPEAHFATYPPDLIKPCILAGTSAKGCCAKCGSPWERIVARSGGTIGKSWHDHQNDIGQGQRIADPAGKGGRLQDMSHGRHGCEPYKVETIGWQPTCKCEELYCPECCVVIASNEDEKSITKGWSAKKMSAMQGEVFRTGQGKQMVFAGLRGEVDSEEPEDDDRQDGNDQGLCNALSTEPPEREGRRLCDGASGNHGESDWTLLGCERSGSSLESQEGRQSFGELGANDKAATRPDAEAETLKVCSVSALPENDILDWICGTCRNPLERRIPETNPCVTLDCFAGSGTTGAVALELGRKAILIELNPKYVELIKQRCDVTPGLALA